MGVLQMTEAAQRFRLTNQYQTLKNSVHRYLIAQIEERSLDLYAWTPDKVQRFVIENVRRYVLEQRLPINQRETEWLADDATDELMGFGPIQGLIDDDSVSDIIVNGPERVFVERNGCLKSEPVRFIDAAHVVRVMQRILAPLGRRVDESTPMVDARLPDGSRVNAIIPPISLDGPCISIRKFRKLPMSQAELLSSGTMTQAQIDFLHERVRSRANLVVVGGTGAGKTTLLNLLSQWIPASERIITIEDAAELRLRHEHVVRLETRPPNLEGQRAVTTRDLVRNALRMRPDRIVVGEVRGDEVMEVLQAMNTGHDGSMTTLHANSPRDAINRLELLAGMAGFSGSDAMFRAHVGSALNLLVQVSRRADGRRRVTTIAEVDMDEARELRLRELFGYDAGTDRHLDLRAQA